MKNTLFLVLLIFVISCKQNQVQEFTALDYTPYIHDADSIDVKVSIDLLDSNRWGLDQKDLLADFGQLLFHKRSGVRRANCADCHSKDNAGTGFTNRAKGGGEFLTVYNNLYRNLYGRETLIEEDHKPFKNWSNLNAYKLHQANRILSKGVVDSFPLEFQVGVALNEAHFGNDLVLECQSDPFFNDMSRELTGGPFNLDIMKAAISAFQQKNLVTDQNRINRSYKSGEQVESLEGMLLIQQKGCMNCHNTAAIAPTRVLNNPILDSIKAPRLDVNLKDHSGYFHTSEKITLYKAIKRCDEIASTELGVEPYKYRDLLKIKTFINKELYDSRYGSK